MPASLMVAIDISNLRHDVLIEAPGWRSRKRVVVPNRADEFRHFAKSLHSLASPIESAFEATGDYHRALAHFLAVTGLSFTSGFQLGPWPASSVRNPAPQQRTSDSPLGLWI